MKVILIQDVKNLGKKNSVVNVPDGYFKNYLLPHKLAVNYSPAAIKHLDQDLANLAKDHATKLKEAQNLKAQLEKLRLQFELNAHNSNAFGSISQKQIIEAVKEHQLEITKYMFDEDFAPLKIGHFKVNLTLFEDVKATIDIMVSEK